MYELYAGVRISDLYMSEVVQGWRKGRNKRVSGGMLPVAVRLG